MIFLVPYAYDRMPGGKPREGVLANRLGSKARCDALFRVVRKRNDLWSVIFILTAGYSKESARSTEKIPESIAEQMCIYVKEQGFSTHLSPKFSWGTFEETRNAISVISSFALESVKEPCVYVSTNLGHMPRVWLCWFFLRRHKTWEVHFVLADHSFTPKEWLQETAKFFQYLYRFVFKKW